MEKTFIDINLGLLNLAKVAFIMKGTGAERDAAYEALKGNLLAIS